MDIGYIEDLLGLRRRLDQIIDNEVEATLKGRNDAGVLIEGLDYAIKNSYITFKRSGNN